MICCVSASCRNIVSLWNILTTSWIRTVYLKGEKFAVGHIWTKLFFVFSFSDRPPLCSFKTFCCFDVFVFPGWLLFHKNKAVTLSFVCFQVVEDGYEFFAKRQLVTLFSAPNYCGEFDNAGAMMSVDETLMCSFQVIIWPAALGKWLALLVFNVLPMSSCNQILKPADKKLFYGGGGGMGSGRPVTPPRKAKKWQQ